MRQPLPVGVIGVGHLGRHHARIYSTLASVTLVGISDTDVSRGRDLADEFKTVFYSNPADLLARVEAVSVAVPTSVHFPVVQACLNQNCHVLVEKPITSEASEGEHLVQLAKDKGMILHVGHVERFNPILEQVRPAIRRPSFIECHRLSPFQPRGTDVDVVRDLMIHDLDLILSLGLGGTIQIEARGLPIYTEHPDIANVRMVFESGCLVNLTASRISTGRLRKLRIYQRDCYISVDLGTKEGVINTCHVSESGVREIQSQKISGTDGDALTRELDCFVQAILGGAPANGVSGQEGVDALRMASHIMSLIHQSVMERPSSIH
ncbi:MAG: Gfo/Idh/MocA family oxidoreductase [Nitrospirota bacterium]|nr:Gfo/Idh/MocA family oxidoreductase [Nitrospirota bacterium]MDH5585791.1 Gfo/Idh/MocA family oxidoreductase [Nitrospirota bacterium]MDH5773826.1 Gfo/Idh/MocA family oxidoreductase [Nitrospirota bacterium]